MLSGPGGWRGEPRTDCLLAVPKSFAMQREINQVVGHDDPGIYSTVFGEEMKEMSAVQQLQWFSFGEVESGLPVSTGCHQNTFGCPFILYRSEEVADGTDAHRILVTFGLDDDLSAENGPLVESDAVHAAIARRTRLARVQAHCREQVCYQALEFGWCQFHEVRTAVQPGHHIHRLDEPRIDHVEFDQRPDRQQFRG